MCTLEIFLEIFASILTNCLVTLLNIYARTFFRGRFLVFEKSGLQVLCLQTKLIQNPEIPYMPPLTFGVNLEPRP